MDLIEGLGAHEGLVAYCRNSLAALCSTSLIGLLGSIGERQFGVLARVRKTLRPHVQRRICYVDEMRWKCWRVLLHSR